MTPDLERLVHRTSAVAAGIAAVLSPIPLADELVLLPVYAVLASRIGRAHGLAARDLPWRPLGQTALHGLAARAAVNLAVAFVPGLAAAANAVTAVALTEVFGRYADEACADPKAARALGVADMAVLLQHKRAGDAAA